MDQLEKAIRKHNRRIRAAANKYAEDPTDYNRTNAQRIANEAWEQLRWDLRSFVHAPVFTINEPQG